MDSNKLHLFRKLNLAERFYSFLVIFVPLLVTFYTLFSGMLFNIGWATLLLFIISYCATVLGITLGFHRLLTHHSFKTTRLTKIVLVCLGCMSYEGPPFFWIAAHRRHHKFTEIRAADPHSPRQHENQKLKGLYYAHIGWMLDHTVENWKYYIADLLQDSDLKTINKYYLPIALSGLLIPGIINGLIYQSLYHFIEGILVCGIVRVCLQQNVTWAINSICHCWGKKDFECEDDSKNNWLFAILALGEGWHNGHHAFPSSAKHGLKKGQFDFSFEMIRLLKYYGKAWDIKQPDILKINSKSKQYKS